MSQDIDDTRTHDRGFGSSRVLAGSPDRDGVKPGRHRACGGGPGVDAGGPGCDTGVGARRRVRRRRCRVHRPPARHRLRSGPARCRFGTGSVINPGLGLLFAVGQVPADIPEGFAAVATLRWLNLERADPDSARHGPSRARRCRAAPARHLSRPSRPESPDPSGAVQRQHPSTSARQGRLPNPRYVARATAAAD